MKEIHCGLAQHNVPSPFAASSSETKKGTHFAARSTKRFPVAGWSNLDLKPWPSAPQESVLSIRSKLVHNFSNTFDSFREMVMSVDPPISKQQTVDLQWLEHSWLVYHDCFELILGSLEKKSHSCRFGKNRVIFIFIFIVKMVYCVFSLESPR